VSLPDDYDPTDDGPPTRDLKPLKPLPEGAYMRRDPAAKIDLDAPERILDSGPPLPAKPS
jgi:hypothetical protein